MTDASHLLAVTTLEIAKSELGQKEATGNNDGPFVRMLQRWLAKGATWMDGQPWCATFATWCLYQAGEKLSITPMIPKSGSTSSLYAWFKDQGKLLASPEPLCIGMMKGDGGTPGKTHHHTFLVEYVDGEFVCGIDGNWKNAVTRTHHAIKDCDFGPIC